MKKENSTIIITSIIAGVILIIALVALTTFNPFSSSKNTITVEGIANIKATPDLLIVYYSIETSDETATKAKDANNEIFEDLISEIEKIGIAEEKLTTQGFNVYPNYEWINGNQIENGYKAIHSLELELSSEDFNKISEVIDAGVNAGAGISYINFELSSNLQNEYKAKALKLASEDATIKANAVASGLEKEVGSIVSVSVNQFGYSPWNIYTSSRNGGDYALEDAEIAKESVASINPSEQDINAIVSVTFKIK